MRIVVSAPFSAEPLWVSGPQGLVGVSLADVSPRWRGAPVRRRRRSGRGSGRGRSSARPRRREDARAARRTARATSGQRARVPTVSSTGRGGTGLTAATTLACPGQALEVLHQSCPQLTPQVVDLIDQHPAEVGSQVLDPLGVLQPGNGAVRLLKGVLSQLGVTCTPQGKALDLGILPDRQQLLLETRSSVWGSRCCARCAPPIGPAGPYS